MIVVGYDGSDCAHSALDQAIELAKQLGEELLITFGYEPGVKQMGDKATARGLKRAQDAGVKAKVALVPERPVDALVTVAEEHDARAIVVGTYGENPIKAVLLGSTPYKLLHLAERPVLVVPAE